MAGFNLSFSSAWRKVIQIFAASLLVVLALGALKSAGWLQRLEWLLQDQLQRLAAGWEKPHPDLEFVVLDQRSLDAAEAEYGLSWPWPRQSYAEAITFLQQAGSRAVLLDFIFSENSTYGEEDDQALASSLQQAGQVFLPILARNQAPETGAHLLSSERPDVWLQLDAAPSLRPAAYNSLLLPAETILRQAAGLGLANFTPDADGVCRRFPPFLQVGEACLAHLGLAPLQFTSQPGRISLTRHRLAIGARTWPLDANGQVVLRYPGSWKNYPRTSLIDVITSYHALQEGLEPAVHPNRFRNKTVILGSTAPGLMDLRKTPLDSEVPGFFIHAAVWTTFARGLAWDESLRPLLAWPLLILAALLGAYFGTRSFARGLAGAGLSLLLLASSLLALFFLAGVSWDMATPFLALVGGYGLSLGWSYRQEQRQKHFIQSAFTQVLSHTVLEELMRNPQELATVGRLAEVSVYFSDLENFTGLSEKLSPPEVVKIMNLYLGGQIDTIVEDYQGYVDKFIGDAVMAFWNAPVADPHHARSACLAAWYNLQKLRNLQATWQRFGLKKPLDMRIGLNTGPALVGMMGSPKKLNYTVIGDTVNLASRLEAANKEFGTHILASEDTIQAAGDAVVSREIDRIRVKGKSQPTRIYEVLGPVANLTPDLAACLEHFQAGTALYWNRKFKAALKQFQAAAKARPGDAPSKLFMQRCRRFLRQPPPRPWDGVTTLTKK